MKSNTEPVTNTNPSGHSPHSGVVQTTFLGEINGISHGVADVSGKVHLVMGVL